jgi:hypothetical protein
MRISSPIRPKKKIMGEENCEENHSRTQMGKKKRDQIGHLHLQNMLKIGPNLQNLC